MKSVRYEVHWVTQNGKQCVCFGDNEEETKERQKLTDALNELASGKHATVFLIHVRKITIEVV